ncbi:uncharacterized protein L969DRAFT_51184 [Mixia osmundae IAM 14324]|uniref:Uncharacterized protein n=1 Tax=Mixia osmundae (strain CBS 9802 / IAM 14324 / JCM 22182 / KY 12970) TaxID=764103 RepID=G7E0J5_MIXOS|nr:uncharacterized protein L969DRAFT_51184 [Mixia osmundae IAM 14324]KEI38368.1 hypothetical protein L969DRAFT_51184 [Mixia osmundae IAM 14324]GAA96355.1 hypothetical protein E5Q_03021 [Mixia osmundae IAM 14324]
MLVLLTFLLISISLAAASPVTSTPASEMSERATPLGYIFTLGWSSAGYCSVAGNKYDITRHTWRSWTTSKVSFKVPIDAQDLPLCVQGDCKRIEYDRYYEGGTHPPTPDYRGMRFDDYTSTIVGGEYPGCCEAAFGVKFYLNPHNGAGQYDTEREEEDGGAFMGFCNPHKRSSVSGKSCYEVLDHPQQPFVFVADCVGTRLRPTISSTPYYS